MGMKIMIAPIVAETSPERVSKTLQITNFHLVHMQNLFFKFCKQFELIQAGAAYAYNVHDLYIHSFHALPDGA